MLYEVITVRDLNRVEQLGGEERQSGELQRLAFGEGVAELQHAMVRDTDDVAGERVVDQLAPLREKRDDVSYNFV